MASENYIRAKARQQLEADGWLVWYPARVRFQDNDIFKCFDAVAARKDKVRWIQWTTKPNMNARKKKIWAIYREHDIRVPFEVWGWDDKTKQFLIYLEDIASPSSDFHPPKHS